MLKEVVGQAVVRQEGERCRWCLLSEFLVDFFVEMPYYSGAYLPLSESWIDEDDVRVRH